MSNSGLRTPIRDIVIPSDMAATELKTYLDDMYHEFATEHHPEVVLVSEEP